MLVPFGRHFSKMFANFFEVAYVFAYLLDVAYLFAYVSLETDGLQLRARFEQNFQRPLW